MKRFIALLSLLPLFAACSSNLSGNLQGDLDAPPVALQEEQAPTPVAMSASSVVETQPIATAELPTSAVTGEEGQSIAIPADQDVLVSCAGTGIFNLLGPVISKDPDILFHVIEAPGTPDEKYFYWATERTKNPGLPANTLNNFERGRQYLVNASSDLTLTCGQYLEKK